MPDSLLLKLPNTFRAFYGGFTELHRVQRQALTPILEGRDLVVQAATGSGKSEAVLAPCLERVIQSGQKTAVLYIIPTRALAMDLKRRFESIITERLGLNFALRTGDKKLTGGKCPDIMLTTPESLDVMLGSSNTDLRGFLSRVGTVIIDEVHSFIYQYRGRHLVYLFNRLERRTGRRLQKIAMSATISRVGSVIDFFGFHPSAPSVITDVKRKIRARLLHIKQEKTEIPSLVNDLYDTWQYRKILIFVNSRVACDRIFGIINQTGRFKGVSELHYSNLKPRERKKAETRFRTSPHALCIATSTLELGIDVGDVDAVLLYQPPGSVAAFLQRIGRANRREQEINFWGICAGEGASDQLVRFLALLELSESGRVESHPGRILPSVLSQQVISCLYEKKRLTLSSLQSLFPDRRDTLPAVFASLEKNHWLKPSGTHGLFGGGWQYRNHLFDYKIWGNFPEAEVDYILEVSDRPIADIPQSIVSQMAVGDKIYLAGRLLRILTIDMGEQKKVLARPSTGQAEKQLAWIGLGPPISHEVAKAMGKLLNTGEIKDKSCLFSRTQRLFCEALEQSKKKVVLKNGIEIVPGRTMPFRYRTFLGTMGNLLLEWSIREHLADEDLVISSDEMGVECSHRIRFEALNLPVDRDDFQIWVRNHFKILRSLVSLNLFCKTLPRELLVQELMEFLFDQKLARTFAHYLESSSTIVSGDMATLHLGTSVQDNPIPCVIDICCKESLLEREKEKSCAPGNKIYLDFFQDRWHHTCFGSTTRGTLTATMVSDYFFHTQCHRRFCLKFINLAPPVQHQAVVDDDKLRTLFLDQGISHEQEVLRELKSRGAAIISMNTTGSQEVRFKAFLYQLKAFLSANNTLQKPAISPAEGQQQVFLSQCQLMVDVLDQDTLNIKGVGVPDLLILSVKEENGKKTIVIEVGDIKSSSFPGYHHKWQVAFYALLLEKIIGFHDIPARVAETGFIITHGKSRQKPGQRHSSLFPTPSLYEIHEFDLKAYLAAVPVLFKTFHHILSCSAALADHRLKPHCVACDWFFSCYHRALESEDIQFLPGLTPGELLKLRQMGCGTMAGLHDALKQTGPDLESSKEEPGNMETGLTLEQKKKFLGQTRAVLENKLFLKKKNTRLFPNNISHAFFVCTKKDPLNGGPRALGYQVVASGNILESYVWIIENNQDQRKAWQAFVNRISASWEKSISNGKGPHIFHFGSRSRQDILDWGEREGEKKPGFLWQTQPSHWTDLGRVFTSHFYLPAPGAVSLFALAHVFGLVQELDPPQTLFHLHGANDVNGSKLESTVSTRLSIMADLFAKACFYLKSQWMKEWVTEWETDLQSDTTKLLPYLMFIKEEQRLQEEDILTLQELTLGERMLRFRALGHLRVDHTRLDHEGRFLYGLKCSRETRPSKFRPGDFLRLAPHGLADIQTGFPVILAQVDTAAKSVSLLSRSGRLSLSKHLLYSLEEDTSDWNQEKLIHVATTVFKGTHPHSLGQLLSGKALDRQPSNALPWLEKWLPCHDHGLNSAQQRALALPFQNRTSIIQGPPGTGKTHLLGWMLIALILQAHETRQPLRIGVSALTHQAIDTILKKVTELANQYFPDVFPGRCIKWGKDREPGEKTGTGMTMDFSDDAKEVLDQPWLILGATGYGFYQLFNSKDKGFPLSLDWVIFDEASQVPLPQALLSLIYSRGNFLFLGDVHQLPPIVRGNYGEYPGEHQFLNQSILANFLEIYPPSHMETLNITYRMNKEICAFPGKTWYKRLLCPATSNAHGRLTLKKPLSQSSLDVYDQILDPEKPVVLVMTEHQGCSQKSDMEADLMAILAHRLMSRHGILPDQMALISPHRAQNNAILKTLGDLLDGTSCGIARDLGLPCVDTVERVQGAERDIIIFGITSSDPDHIFSEFLNNPNRLNVAMTRAKTKLIVIGSQAFFSGIPDSETLLVNNACFKTFMRHCQTRDAVFNLGV